MTVAMNPCKSSQGLQPFGTYVKSSRSTVVHGRANVTNGSTFINLDHVISYPTGLPADKDDLMIPLLVALCPSGFEDVIDQVGTMDFMDVFVEAGAVVVCPKYRVADETPVSDGDVAGDTMKKRAVRGAIQDIELFMKYVRMNSFMRTANYRIDPRRILIIGESSGGQLGQLYCMRNQPNHVAAMAGFACGMGLDSFALSEPASSPDHTADLRAFGTEAGIVLGLPPEISFTCDNDFVIGGSWNVALADRLDLDANSIAYRKADGASAFDHDNHADFGNVTYSGDSVTPLEACRRFFNDSMADLSERPDSKFNFS